MSGELPAGTSAGGDVLDLAVDASCSLEVAPFLSSSMLIVTLERNLYGATEVKKIESAAQQTRR